MSTGRCEAHMCDGSGWRHAGGWHLLTPCYCKKGREVRDEHARRMHEGNEDVLDSGAKEGAA